MLYSINMNLPRQSSSQYISIKMLIYLSPVSNELRRSIPGINIIMDPPPRQKTNSEQDRYLWASFALDSALGDLLIVGVVTSVSMWVAIFVQKVSL